MTGAAVEHAHMNVGAGATGEALKEIVHKFCLQISHAGGAHFRFDDRGGTATEIHGCEPESFVHGHEEITCPQNAATVAESTVEDLAERNADIFHGVVL